MRILRTCDYESTLICRSTLRAFAPHKTWLEVLREDLGLSGTKHGCELGECGTCAVLVNGRSILSCLMLGLDAEGREVKTIEGNRLINFRTSSWSN